MSAFEKLPREIRNLIYEGCLCYDGVIIPFPRDYEREIVETPPWAGKTSEPYLLPRRRSDRDAFLNRNAFLGYPYVKRKASQTEKAPCVALLGVNSTIRDEAASILFGKNVWRLSSMSYAQGDRYRLWETYAKHFRHVVTRFEAQDIDWTRLLDISMSEMDRVEEDPPDSDHFDQTGTANLHPERLDLLKDGFIAKRNLLRQMNLRSLVVDFSNLFCSQGCCRQEALRSCLECLGSIGPWCCRFEQEQSKQSNQLKSPSVRNVRVLGLKNEKEKSLFRDAWVLKVD